MEMTIVENLFLTVTGGIVTHLDFHVAAAIDSNGGVLGVETFDTTTGGYRHLVAWLAGFGTISLIGVEGTGSTGSRSGATGSSPTHSSSPWPRSTQRRRNGSMRSPTGETSHGRHGNGNRHPSSASP
jgi:hypothetical protein